jgi:parvulin-like peptidyl-prolyl isomerase
MDFQTIPRAQSAPRMRRLERGGISDVVRDKDGYHLIQLHERVPAAVIPVERAKEKLRQRLALERGRPG